MKKSLFLLPLLASLALVGCGKKDGESDNKGGNGGNGGNGGGEGENSLVLDFTDTVWKDERITPYISAEEDMGVLKSFTYEDIVYNDIGCYASAGYDGAPNYLMMKNTKYGAKKDQYATVPAFFGNKTPFSSPIKKVTVEVEGSSSSGNTIYRVNIGSSEMTSAQTSGGATGSKGQTFSTTSTASDAYYFSVSTNKTADNKIYNGQLVSVTIEF